MLQILITSIMLSVIGEGNLLWDCINVLTEQTKEQVRKLGGIKAIAISHPHFYTGMADWAAEFGAAVYVHKLDKEWVTTPSGHVHYWTGARLHSTILMISLADL